VRFVISHRGIPLGHADFTPHGLAIADFVPYPAYGEVREAIRQASEFLWAMGFFGVRGANPARIPEDVLGRAASLEFEIRDVPGELVHADWINLIERPGPAPAPVFVARFRMQHDGVPGAPLPRARSDRDSA
jgi:hypothetical protein